MTVRCESGAPVAGPRYELDRLPRGPRAAIAAATADRLFRRAVRRLPLQVEYGTGLVLPSVADGPVMTVHRPDRFATRLGTRGLIGFGEAYMAGDWSAADPATVLAVFAAGIDRLVPAPLRALRRCVVAAHPSSDRNTREQARGNIARHYDLSNEFFGLFLDDTMTYSSALFGSLDPAPSWAELAPAQGAKIDRILDTAHVGPGTRVLEIGTGWGELAVRAAARGTRVRSVTLSAEQCRHARDRVAAAGLTDRVEIDLLDYRAVDGHYDAVVSVEMVEAVGYDFLPGYFRTVERALLPGGRAVIQAITMPHDRMLATRHTHTWIQEYIFPGGFLPSARLLTDTAATAGLVVRENFSIGPHYAHTLRLWQRQFLDAETAVTALGFDETFRRMWQLYLAHSEAGFRSGYLDVGQFLLTRGNGHLPAEAAQ
ncbi:methyltransferase domain-containing protein [Nocardia sp. SYP-A9097]|uniref:SAM-dependent methyltransferase n=1 Tax=Nocardia sp. SYP-A9097 TaxID=2663237 RepID=UPI00129B4FAE|nr:cyclopropane-fatty-acyl-phospholipid synthase family protein [Nocardia sp. SYP-A9097]MRH87589.1 methyltransferase domain-containing protein [Nocardia sp. SYP-A9097]